MISASRAPPPPGVDRWPFMAKAAQLQGFARAPDVVHAHFGPEGEEMAALKHYRALRQPLVVSMHGFDLTRPVRRKDGVYPYLFTHADRIVVTTAFMAEQAQKLGCAPSKILQLPIGIRLERFPWSPRHWSPGETLKILSVSRLVEKKGIAYALRAVSRIAAAGVAVEYTVIGDGALRADLSRLAFDLGIDRAVRFRGALGREAVLEELARAQLFLLPSVTADDGDAEGQGMVLQEAQACGIPVIATRHGGLAEGCLEGISAILVPERDEGALAAAIQKMLDRHREWPEMGKAGRQLVETRYRLETHIGALEKLYRSLI